MRGAESYARPGNICQKGAINTGSKLNTQILETRGIEYHYLLGAGRRNDEELAVVLSVDQGLGGQSSGLLCLEEYKPEVWDKEGVNR